MPTRTKTCYDTNYSASADARVGEPWEEDKSIGDRMRVSTGDKCGGCGLVVTSDGRRDSSSIGEGPRDGGRDAYSDPEATTPEAERGVRTGAA